MNVVIIPARGGSKRIPQKNIKLFMGEPIIAYAIAAAKKSRLFDKIVVSTDSEEIAEVALQNGAEVPFFRPKELSDDYVATIPVLLHAENWLLNSGFKLEYCCCIYPTNPLLSVEYLKRGLLELKSQPGKSFSFSAVSYSHPIFRSFTIDDGQIEMLWPENYSKRSQDFPVVYHDAAQFYWWRSTALKKDDVFFGSRAVPIILPASAVQDIDSTEDWVIAETKYQLLKKQGAL